MTARFELPDAKYGDLGVRRNFQMEVIERLEALPGVESAAVVTFAPLTYSGGSMPYRIEGEPEEGPGDRPVAAYRVVSPGYFRTMGISLASGREFLPTDNAASRPVAIVNQAASERIGVESDALVRRIATSSRGPWLDVIGVIADVRQFGIDVEAAPEIYVTHLQAGENFFTVPFFQPHDVVVRTSVKPNGLIGALRGEVRSIDPQLPLFEVRTMDDVVAGSLQSRALQVLLIAVFAGMALIVAAVGIYAVMSYSVIQRTREIGVRVCLGARDRDVLRMVVGEGLGLVALGLGVGLPVAFLLTGVVSELLYETRTTDPWTYAGVCCVLLLVGTIASYLPAMRATRIEPARILRAE